jgi:BA14K-like protein
MKTVFKNAAAAVLASVIALTGVIPAQAQVIRPTAPVAATSDVTNVQFRRDRYERRNRYEARRYWRGHRGYRERRAGYRYHNGYWYPLAAFAAGAIIGGAIANQPRAVPRAGNINPQHYQWCQNRYRSYDSYSNTFQPYNGPRQQCLSPYY